MRHQLVRLHCHASVLTALVPIYESKMSQYQSDLLQLLDERGYIHQVTDAGALDALAAKAIAPGYIGYDPTAPSLHVGHLIQIMLQRRLQQAGHKPIVVVGGGTGKIGDPSFKDEARAMLTEEKIAENVSSIRGTFAKMLDFGDGPTDAILVDNAEWLDRLEYLPFLREVGQHFSINRMLSFDSVKLRLDREQSLSFLEFNYMILQAYDFRELSQRYGCRLQMGGSDQWGNIVNGIELTRRMDSVEVYGLTTPLLSRADGSKMGKTASGAVWLNEDQLPNHDFWQYWRNTDDRDVGKFLRLFTDVPLDEIARIETLEGSEINDAKVLLANEVTAMVRGREAADSAAQTAAQTFAGGGVGADLPVLEVSGEGVRLGAACTALGFTASNGEAKRKIAEGAVRIDDEAITDAGYLVEVASGQTRKLSLGRKRHAILRGA